MKASRPHRVGWLAVAALAILGVVLGLGSQSGTCYDSIDPARTYCTSTRAWWLAIPSAEVAMFALVKALRRR